MTAALVAGPRVDAWQDYARATRGPYFAEWCASELVHGGDFDGQPFVLEDWQQAVMGEALALRDWTLGADGDLASWLPYWRTVVAVVPRGNGKSPLIAAMAIDHLVSWPADPRVFIAAADEQQARLLFEFVVGYLRSCEQYVEGVDYVVREYVGEVSLVGRPGFIKTIATNKPSGLHGERPSLAICDELHEWRTLTQRRSYDAIVTGARKRPAGQIVAITTAGEAGERETSLLGALVDATHQRGESEHVNAALTISRHHESRTVLYEWSAPTQDPEDLDAIKLANPASWRTVELLAEAAHAPDLTPSTYLQYFGNVWSESRDAWIKRGTWGSMVVDGLRPAPGTRVVVGVDAATTEDCTAVAWAWRLEDDDRIGVASMVWAAKHGNAAHAFVPGGAIDKRCVVAFVRDVLAGEHGLDVAEVVYDPARFHTEALMLDEAGFDTADAWGKPTLRSMAWTHWYGRVQHGRLAHDGDPVLADHVCGAQARMDERGWSVSKLKQRRAQKIDALVAAAMAAWRLDVDAGPAEPWVGAW